MAIKYSVIVVEAYEAICSLPEIVISEIVPPSKWLQHWAYTVDLDVWKCKT